MSFWITGAPSFPCSFHLLRGNLTHSWALASPCQLRREPRSLRKRICPKKNQHPSTRIINQAVLQSWFWPLNAIELLAGAQPPLTPPGWYLVWMCTLPRGSFAELTEAALGSVSGASSAPGVPTITHSQTGPSRRACPGWSLLLNGSSLLIFLPVTKSCSPHWPNWVVISQVRWLSSSGLAEIMHFFCCLFGNMFYNTWHVPLSLKSLLALEINQCAPLSNV